MCARILASWFLLCVASLASAASLTLAWNPSPGAAGYRLYYGTVPATYTGSIDAGGSTSVTVPGLTVGQTYYIAVTAYNALGAQSGFSSEVSAVATAVAIPPVASFTASPTQGQLPLVVGFNSSASSGSITSYAWTFGDGGISTSANPSYTYTAPGIYNVALTVAGPGGANTQTRAGYVVVTRAPNRHAPGTGEPVAQFVASATSGAAPLTVDFTSLSTGAIASHAWTFGDGGTSTDADPSHVYLSPGIYTVALTVAGPNGSSARTRSGYVVVSPPGTPKLTTEWAAIDSHTGNGTTGNLNGILEPGESVTIAPTWHNDSAAAVTATGTITSFTGPAGAKYAIQDRTASYGTMAPGADANCRTASGNCYRVTVANPATRPAPHWDARLLETLSTGNIAPIVVHIGQSFTDVGVSDASYVAAETVLHNNVMSAFGDGSFRPTANSSRSDAIAATARAVAASVREADVISANGQVGPNAYKCAAGGTSLFADVSPTEGGCPEIHFLAAYGVDVTFGCSNASGACPGADSSRAMAAVLVAGAAAGGDANVPASGTFAQTGLPRTYFCIPGGSSRFADVSVTSPYCRHVNYLWATGALDAFGDGTFRPASPVTRAQLAELIAKGFALTLD